MTAGSASDPPAALLVAFLTALLAAALALPRLPMPLNSAVSAGPQTGLVALRAAAPPETTPPAAWAAATDACEVFAFPMRMETGCL